MLKPGSLDSFLAGFPASLNPIKSEHDFVFRPWGETLGCVQIPSNKEIKVKPCLSRLTLLKHFITQFWTKTGRFDKMD